MGKNKFKIGLGTFDFIKGAAIILIILGHISFEYDFSGLGEQSTVLRIIATVFASVNISVMPCFFLISGYTFKPKSSAQMLKSSFSNFVKPYAIVTLIIALLYPTVNVLQYGIRTQVLKDTAAWVLAFLFGLHDPWAKRKVFWGIQLQLCGVVWFLLALFIASNVFNLIVRIKGRAGRLLSVVLCTTVGYFLAVREFTYYCIPQGLIAVLYLFIGYELNKIAFFEKKCKLQAGVTLLCYLLSTIASLKCKYDIATNTYEPVLVALIGSSLGGVALLVCGTYFGRLEWKSLDWMKTVGMYSFYIMCIHSVETNCLPWNQIFLSMPTQMGHAIVLEILLKIAVIGSACVIVKKVNYQKYRRMRKKMATESFIKNILHGFEVADEKVAFDVYDGASVSHITYRQFLSDILIYTGYFVENKIKHQHIALVAPNSYEWVVAFYAICASGNAVVPMDSEANDEILIQQMMQSDISLICCDTALTEKIFSKKTQLPIVKFSDLSRAYPILSNEVICVDKYETILLLLTSGTTGKNKVVEFSAFNVESSIKGHSFIFDAAEHQRVMASILPMYHIAGIMSYVLLPQYKHWTVCIGRGAKYMLVDLPVLNPTHICVVPEVLSSIVKVLKKEIILDRKLLENSLKNIHFLLVQQCYLLKMFCFYIHVEFG